MPRTILDELVEETQQRLAGSLWQMVRRAYADGLSRGAARLEFLAAMQSPPSFAALRRQCELEAAALRKKAADILRGG